MVNVHKSLTWSQPLAHSRGISTSESELQFSISDSDQAGTEVYCVQTRAAALRQ